MGCFLQYLYTGDYFPRIIAGAHGEGALEEDEELEESTSRDEDGRQLLKHAKVYTLAEKLQLPELKTLAHNKIHMINSTAVGELSYAKYVYANTPEDDVIIRGPIATFWAHKSMSSTASFPTCLLITLARLCPSPRGQGTIRVHDPTIPQICSRHDQYPARSEGEGKESRTRKPCGAGKPGYAQVLIQTCG